MDLLMDQDCSNGVGYLTRTTQIKTKAEQQPMLLTRRLTTNGQPEPATLASFKATQSRLIRASWERSQVDPVAPNELEIL